MTGQSPTQLSLAALRAQGYVCWIVEHWNAFTKRRVDLFGMWDILGVGPLGTIAVQTTTTGVSARVKKISDDDHAAALQACREAGWTLQVHGWTSKKVGNRRVYKQRIVEVS